MKFNVIPRCNQELIVGALNHSSLRVDGRKKEEYRPMEIVFGKNLGSVLVSLGNTRVMTTITADIVEPRPSKPSEGMLRISVDLSPMASPNWESGRLTDDTVEISRMLERSIRDAKCLDLESLCLIVGKKCWALEANIIVFNTEGNLVEASSISLIASLSHFKRSDVTVTDEGNIIIHDFDDRHPIPLTVFHYPFCTKFCFFEGTKHIVVDPIEVEEEVCDGYIIVGANAHRELTAVHISGKSRIDKDVILKCSHRSIERTKRLTDVLKKALQQDKQRRQNEEVVGFGHYLRSLGPALLGCTQTVEGLDYQEDQEEKKNTFDEIVENTKAFRFMEYNQQDNEEGDEGEEDGEDQHKTIGRGRSSQWDFEASTSKKGHQDASHEEAVDISDDSSDEEVMVMDSTEFKVK